jgi:hypothetical protein
VERASSLRLMVAVGMAVLVACSAAACGSAAGAATSGAPADHAPRRADEQTVKGISIQVPSGWTLRRDPVPALVEP